MEFTHFLEICECQLPDYLNVADTSVPFQLLSPDEPNVWGGVLYLNVIHRTVNDKLTLFFLEMTGTVRLDSPGLGGVQSVWGDGSEPV